MISLNILDYALVDEGLTPSQALQESAELAILADTLGYKRFWVPEQHYAFSIASSSPEMFMMYLATVTKRIRIGSGGVMIPHYSPYKIAENFRMLEALHPNRIDLGIGNSPGGKLVQTALHEDRLDQLSYSQQVKDIIKYVTDDDRSEHRLQKLMATPQVETNPEIWMLGAGGRSTKIAAEQGTSYIYAHFFRPSSQGIEYIKEYRKSFQPSKLQAKPNVGVAVFVVIAEHNRDAEELAQTFHTWSLWLETAKNPKHFPSVESVQSYQLTSFEQQKLNQMKRGVIIGNPQKVKLEIERLATYYNADEITIVPVFAGATNRRTGIRLLAEEFQLI